MVFIATTHEYESGLDKKLIRERRINTYGEIKNASSNKNSEPNSPFPSLSL